MKKTLIGCCAIMMLAGCSMKTATYTFNQTTAGECQPQVSALRGADNQTAQDAGRGSTNSGGSGNTIIIIESSDQDAKSDPDLSGMADAVVDKLTGGLTDVSSVIEDIGTDDSATVDQGSVEVIE